MNAECRWSESFRRLNRVEAALVETEDAGHAVQVALPALHELFDVPVAAVVVSVEGDRQMFVSSRERLGYRFLAGLKREAQLVLQKFQAQEGPEIRFGGEYLEGPGFSSGSPVLQSVEERPLVHQLIVRGGELLGLIVLAGGGWEMDDRTRGMLENLARHLGITLMSLERAGQVKTCTTRMVQAAKMSALGELSATIVHEINNPLTNVKGYAQLVLGQLGPEHAVREDVMRLMANAERIRHIVQTLLRFARKQDSAAGRHRVGEICDTVLDLVGPQLRQVGIEAVVDFQPDEPEVRVDRGQMEQVVLNLVLNAVQAMSSGGRLTLKTEAVNGELVLTVRDTGAGMSREVLSRIFEPFFTTKGEGRGTGLGLSFSRRVVENHGGRMEVESRPGEGTEFRVRLPRVKVEVATTTGAGSERNGV